MRNDFYVGMYEDQYLAHSFKGTFWKKGHKYIKRIGNVYYYAKKANEFNREARENLKTMRVDERAMEYFPMQERYLQADRYETWVKAKNNRDRALRLKNTYSSMATKEAQKMFGKTGGEIVSKVMQKVARPKSKKIYRTVNQGYAGGKYVEAKAPLFSKIKKKRNGDLTPYRFSYTTNLRRKKYFIP